MIISTKSFQIGLEIKKCVKGKTTRQSCVTYFLNGAKAATDKYFDFLEICNSDFLGPL